MANALVDWVSTTRLSCDSCLPAAVWICVPAGIVAQKECICCDEEALTDYPYRMVMGSLISSCAYPIRKQGGIVGYTYTYRFSYDSDDLVQGYALSSTTIRGVTCDGCLTNLMQDFAGYDVKVVEDPPGVITITNQHGCEFVFETGQVVLSVENTTSVDLTLTDGVLTADANISENGTNALTLLSDGLAVLISTMPGNQIQLLPDGLYVGNCEGDCMGCCNIEPWVDFSATAVFTPPDTMTGLVIDQAKYKRSNGVVFIKFDMRATLTGTTGSSAKLIPPVTGVPDDAQASYILQGVVNGVAQVLNWRYDLGAGQLIFFMPDAGGAVIPNGVFEVHLSAFYEEAL